VDHFQWRDLQLPDLRKELKRGDLSFRSESDTEVILEAYRTWERSALRG